MKEKYVDSKVWLRSWGCVIGWDLDDVNAYIDKWNSSSFAVIRQISDFWAWLSWETDTPLYGFSALWNSKLDLKVHTIRR